MWMPLIYHYGVRSQQAAYGSITLFIYSLHGYSTIIASSGDFQTDISNYYFFF
jgi:hypothetical protein